jgi:group I intron endonuclease
MSIYSIYKATCILNGKTYIGFATNVDVRIRKHKNLYKNKNTLFYSAIRKHGWNNFVWEVIYQSKDLEHCKNTMEKHFIEEYKSFVGFDDCNGYNLTMGGEGTIGHKHTDEYKRNSSKRMTENNLFRDKKQSEEHINKKIIGMKRFYELNPMSSEERKKISDRLYEYYANNKVSVETKLKISLHNKGKKQSEQTKENNRISQIERYKINPVTKETRDKMRESQVLYNENNKKTCEHCSQLVKPNVYNRWHGKNCRKIT